MIRNGGIKVVVFDDNDLLRDSISMLLEESEEFCLAGSFSHCLDVVRDVSETQPDVVIMDIDMPEMSGIDAARLIRKNFPTVQILMQTVFDDDEKVFASLKAGAVGYILKGGKPGQLLQYLTEVYNGGAPMSPGIARKLMLHFHDQSSQPDQEDFKLSNRESEVLQFLVQGLSYKMIADRMSITYDTVRAHMKKIYQKLHVSSMTEAVAKAIQNRLFKSS